MADDDLDLLTDKITNGETKISNLICRSKISIFEIFIWDWNFEFFKIEILDENFEQIRNVVLDEYLNFSKAVI